MVYNYSWGVVIAAVDLQVWKLIKKDWATANYGILTKGRYKVGSSGLRSGPSIPQGSLCLQPLGPPLSTPHIQEF